jgi:hypothetical protein
MGVVEDDAGMMRNESRNKEQQQTTQLTHQLTVIHFQSYCKVIMGGQSALFPSSIVMT